MDIFCIKSSLLTSFPLIYLFYVIGECIILNTFNYIFVKMWLGLDIIYQGSLSYYDYSNYYDCLSVSWQPAVPVTEVTKQPE